MSRYQERMHQDEGPILSLMATSMAERRESAVGFQKGKHDVVCQGYIKGYSVSTLLYGSA